MRAAERAAAASDNLCAETVHMGIPDTGPVLLLLLCTPELP